jgi:hypothetical protein
MDVMVVPSPLFGEGGGRRSSFLSECFLRS